jgi:hypothetical protein
MVTRDGQDGRDPRQVAVDGSPDADTTSDAELEEAILAAIAVVLDGFGDTPAPPRLPMPTGAALAQGITDLPHETAPLETAAAPVAPGSGGGSSRYDSDLGTLIARLRPLANDSTLDGSPTPGGDFGTPPEEDDVIVLPLAAAGSSPFAVALPPAKPAEPPAPPALPSPPEPPAGSAAGESLFSNMADSVDFNAIDHGGYLDGTQYDAGNGNDSVVLPGDASKALQSGFVPGTLFLAGNGDDTVVGGGLADLIDGGNGNDLLVGGAGDDTLFGGNGADTLIGGAGNDVMTGGTGRDVFVFSLADDEGDNVILDFTTGNGGDRLLLTDVTDANGDGIVNFGDLDAGSHSVSGSATAIVITFDSGTTVTLAGVDGSGIDSFADMLKAKVNVDIL